MKKGKNKKKVAGLAAGLAILALCAGTFAWTSYTEWTKNHMQSKGFEDGRVTVVENFEPDKPIENPDPTKPSEITKDVKVGNFTGTDAFVRVSFEEMMNSLATGGAKKAYATLDASKFPVIVDMSQYYANTKYVAPGTATNDAANPMILATGYKDITDKLKVTDSAKVDKKAAVLGTSGAQFRLIQKGTEDPILILERTVNPTQFPKDFEFNGKTGKVPAIAGTFKDGGTSSDLVTIAQKIDGLVHKDPDTNYYVYTNKYTGTDADKNIGFWGFGVDVAATLSEADWAGAKVNVGAVATPKVSDTQVDISKSEITSKANPKVKIKFTSGNIVTTMPTTPTDVWYYNSADGYFYWCNVLKSGGTTPKPLIDKVVFPAIVVDPDDASKNNPEFNIASYNLWVGLETIPAAVAPLTKESNFGSKGSAAAWQVDGNKNWVSNDTGWGLTKTAAERPTSPDNQQANDAALVTLFTKAATISDIK